MRNLLLTLVCLAAAPAFPVSSDWITVQQLVPDTAIEIHADNGKHRGLLKRADDTRVVLATRSGDRAIPRSAIRKVKQRSSSKRATNAALSGAIGFGAAAIFLGVANARSGGDGFAPEVYPIWGGMVGGIAAGVAALFPGYRTIYQAEP